MEKTMKGLSEAFAGESMANRKYLAFAEQAEKEGYPAVARLFRTIAEAETLHALAHFKTMGGVKSTAENLKAALEGEPTIHQMYPGFIRDAEEEGQKNAVRSFTFANEAEKAHGELYKKALASMEKGRIPPFSSVRVRIRGGRARPPRLPHLQGKEAFFITVA